MKNIKSNIYWIIGTLIFIAALLVGESKYGLNEFIRENEEAEYLFWCFFFYTYFVQLGDKLLDKGND